MFQIHRKGHEVIRRKLKYSFDSNIAGTVNLEDFKILKNGNSGLSGQRVFDIGGVF